MPVTPRDLFVYRTNSSGQRSIRAPGGRAETTRKLGWKKMKSEVSVGRTGGTGAKAFEACVVVGSYFGGSKSIKRASGYTTSCMFGKNPRAALAAAFSRAARQMKKRSGAFARYR